ncbi:MAG TPA: serine/threonine-protein kinase [Polyangiaceae bacterium]|nr:serine/threonine-protein kinase [Polyangiaceae bacterium]
MTTQSQIDDDPQAASARRRLGVVLQDKWTLDSLLGVGGMAAVYSATHRNGKRVAVKMLHAEFCHDEEVRKRFLQEGYAANTIQHDGAVSVLDDDLAPDGAAFIVMELLEGETIDLRWEKGGHRLPVAEVLWIADQLLDVLAAAHAKSVVHRDIKPDNLFLTKGGVLKVLDFGIAKVFEGQTARRTSTRAGMVMGTPAFMAPEQALARWDEVDGRTDLWAVGATMFTLLSGRHVHEADSSQEQLVKSATVPAISVATAASNVPPEVTAIVDRALSFDRAKRWQDAREMQQAVRRALAGIPGWEPSAASGRRTATTLMSPQGEARGAHPVAPTVIDAGAASASSAWVREREARVAESSRLRGTVTDLQQRLAAAKKRSTDAEAELEAGRAERASMESWFKRQVGTRTAAVEAARTQVRGRLVTIARKAIADRGTFGLDFDPARAQIAKLDRAAQAAARDVQVHEAALEAYDVRSLRMGVVLLGVAAVVALALLVAPIVWRATRVVEPPLPTTSQPHK